MMHPHRKIRISLLVVLQICLLSGVALLIVYSTDQAELYTTQTYREPNRYFIDFVSRYLSAVATPLHSPTTEPTIEAYFADSCFLDFKRVVPNLPAPYNRYSHFVAGRKYRDQLSIDETSIIDSLPPKSFLKKSIDILSSKQPSSFDVFNDSLWQLNLKTLSRSDTVFFRCLAIYRPELNRSLKPLYDSVLALPPMRWVVGVNEPGTVKDLPNIERTTVWISYKNKTLYRRGPIKVDRYVEYERAGFLGDDNLVFHLVLPTFMRRSPNYILSVHRSYSEIVWLMSMFAIVMLFLGFTRGYSILPEKKEQELQWELDHSKNTEVNQK